MVKRLATVAAGVLALVAVASGDAFAGSKCSSGKIKNAGKKAAAKLTCLAKSHAKGTFPADSTCIAKAEVKFSTVVAKAEAKVPNDCGTTGDAAAIEADVDALYASIDALAADALNVCDSAKVKQAGKKAAAKLNCWSKAAAKGTPIDSTCMAKAEVKFSASVAKAEAKAPGCSVPGDYASYEALIDATTETIGRERGYCEPILTGKPIAGTYFQSTVAGPKICGTHSAANKFGACTTDANCGGTAGACFATPWVTIGNFPPQATPFGGGTTFTIASSGPGPLCQHTACIPCGNPNAPCASIPDCVGDPQCLQSTCCDQPGFNLPTLLVSGIGACTHVDQIACGFGAVNTSMPQIGDNDVRRNADTSDPGGDCVYGTGDDMPSPGKPCTAVVGGQGRDTFGKIARIVGDGSADAPGMHIRLLTPGLTTAWSGESDPGGCGPTSKYDDSVPNGGTEFVLTSLILNAEPSTAGASGAYVDLNGDACSLATGTAGFGTGAPPAGPVIIGAGAAASPAPYGGGGGYMSAAVSEVFTGLAAAGFDAGYVAVTPSGPITSAAAVKCTCAGTLNCPE